MHRYYVELRLKENDKAKREFLDIVLNYGVRGHDFFEGLELEGINASRKNTRRVILESPERLHAEDFMRYRNLEVERFEEASTRKITCGFETPRLSWAFA